MNTLSIDNLPHSCSHTPGESIDQLVWQTHDILNQVRVALAHVLEISADLLCNGVIDAENMPMLLIRLAGKVDNGVSDTIIKLSDRWKDVVHPVAA